MKEELQGAAQEIYADLQKIPAVNNHLHHGDEAGTLAWYHPQRTVDRDELASRGITPALLRLLDIEGDRITPKMADEVKERYARFCKQRSPAEYYDALCAAANISGNVFMGMPYERDAIAELASPARKFAIYLEGLMIPFDNTDFKGPNESRAGYIGVMERARDAIEQELGPRPAALEDYLEYIDQSVAFYRNLPGVVGAKWGFAYWRTLEVRPVAHVEAQRAYDSGAPDKEAYAKLQDYLAFHTLRCCAQHALPMQIHTGLGANPGLVISESNPALLDHMLSRPEVQDARVAILHGGYPFCREAGVLARRKNVWLDFSWLTLLFTPAILAGMLREWLEFATPYKLLFGVDGTGLALLTGAWCARRALALALGGLIDDGAISNHEALAWARAVLRDNARTLYDTDFA